MDINQMLQQTNALGAISSELGIDPATAEAGAAAVVPVDEAATRRAAEVAFESLAKETPNVPAV